MSQRIDRARRLRRDQTDVERILWSRLRDRRLNGLKFKRQVPIDRYIADLLVKPDAALEHALQASAAAGLPPINVAPNQGKLLHLLATAEDSPNYAVDVFMEQVIDSITETGEADGLQRPMHNKTGVALFLDRIGAVVVDAVGVVCEG